ncbi:MAG TPA: phosphatase PAP2 family protein [Gaiellaceae bacterium]|jgi:undecaprenyl-diphosphatase
MIARLGPAPLFLARPGWGLWVGVALVALVSVMAVLIPSGPLAIDRTWSQWMTDIQTQALKDLALVFNYLGRGLGRALSIVAIGVVVLVARRWLSLLAYALTESLAPLASSTMKAIVDRPRPPEPMVHPSGASFPSGHATYAGATCVALVLLFTSPGPRRRLWWALAGLAIAGMAWSRTYLQVHWLSDVLAGSLLGIGVAFLCFAAVQLAASRPREPRPGAT